MSSVVRHERVARVEQLTLDKAAKHLLEECRMVLPGVLLMWGMVPLAVGTTLDVYLVARVLTNLVWIALASAAFSLSVFGGLWVILPIRARLN